MTKMAELIKRLEERQLLPAAVKERERWTNAVKRLVDNVTSWLEPARSKGLLEVSQEVTKLQEEEFAVLDMPGLLINVPASGQIWLRAVERKGSNGMGRVDLWSTKADYSFYLKNDGTAESWYVAADDRAPDEWPELNVDTFATVMTGLLGL